MPWWWVMVGCTEPSAPRPQAGDEPTVPTPEGPGRPPHRGDALGLPVLPGDPSTLAVPAADEVNDGLFASATVCAECHSTVDGEAAMRDAAGRPVGMFDLWQSTMMANSARDPVWRAAVAVEVAANPAAGAEVEAECLRCHAPMASQDARLSGDPALGTAVLTAGGDLGDLALDGVSCTLCHQIVPDGFGTEASYTGGFVVPGDGHVFGPHDDPFGQPMTMMTGFTPMSADHVLDSELCATCHTLRGHTLGEDGQPTGGEVLEQATYLEWRNSAAGAAGQSCADCHLPTVDEDGVPIETEIALVDMGGPMGGHVGPRSPVGRHVLVGGNVWTPVLLRDRPDLFRPLASARAFDETLAAAQTQLERDTASVALSGVRVRGDTLTGEIVVVPATGHKLPTGIPFRRAWLHVVVTDADGAVVYESGAWDGAGRLVDAGVVRAEERAGGPILPHLRGLSSSRDVVVYESILADEAGAPTFRLTRAAGFYKDTRLLPAGWDPTSPDAVGSEPVGAEGDADFVGGEDRVELSVPVSGAGPFTVTAELRFQPLSPRFVDELAATRVPEALGLLALWEELDRTPVRVASATAEVP